MGLAIHTMARSTTPLGRPSKTYAAALQSVLCVRQQLQYSTVQYSTASESGWLVCDGRAKQLWLSKSSVGLVGDDIERAQDQRRARENSKAAGQAAAAQQRRLAGGASPLPLLPLDGTRRRGGPPGFQHRL